ncbi:NADPH-dependent pterin aldehyde reductase-like isoform X3 [Cucumis melo]|uniref:NADPH-dependent pterin aldehyde reductase-like isoform X3 n=1 Tax=Cucumis melo TaxID=3656 RepID=A0A1S4DYF6_CUCME|nr:NADPH-dependent pterin aldehyde reductase-like isoform X3 [Cucumis melo]
MATTTDEAYSSTMAVSKKVILITGVSKGLGRALALELATTYGHTVIGCSRDQTKLDSLHLQLSGVSPNANHLLLNVDVQRCNRSVEEFARIVKENELVPDIIVNNAGVVNKQGNMWEIDVQDFDNVIDTNIKGSANILRHFIPLMIPYNKGIIVNMSSDAGRDNTPYKMIAPYCASKWGIEGMSKSIAQELPKGMAIVALDPGVIHTDMLESCQGDLASQCQTPEHWVVKAAPTILNLTTKDNGASLTIN